MCVTLPNSLAIDEIVVNIWRFFGFQIAAVCCLGLLNIRHFNGDGVQRLNIHLFKLVMIGETVAYISPYHLAGKYD